MNDVQRSIALSALIPRLPGQLEYFSLQKEVREMDGEVLLQHPEIRHAGTELADFAETAALCELMDVVVSVDTSVAHLSGALGKPTWLLLPYHPDWRWHLRRDDSPWYPSVSLYRQTAAGDWTAVLEKVKADLERLPALCFGGTNSL
jgi:ADP-heptose:LPS heptosyltransferase